MSLNETGIGGIKEAILEVAGDGAYSRLKFEGGVHRVQRVPSTESSGRIHTSHGDGRSSCPRPTRSRSTIDEERDLRIDVKRASGPGGQSVNTTDSAVRITHLPIGPRRRDPGREEPAQEQGQGDGRAALAACTTCELAKQREARLRGAHGRWSAAGDRSEKIRTYNFPQNRVTDHRIGLDRSTTCRASSKAQLDPLIDALVMADQADRLAHTSRRPTDGRSDATGAPSRSDVR